MKIITDNKWKNFKDATELTSKELKQFDWMEDVGSCSFIRYRKRVYSLCDFMQVLDGLYDFEGWHGYSSDSFSSGVLVQISDDGEMYKIATYIS